MPTPPAVSDINQADYEAIEAAVMETARGRWFLAEYARRNRHADTEVLLSSIGRLEQTITEQKNRSGVDRFKVDLVEMSGAIAEARSQLIASPDAPVNGDGAQGLDTIVQTIEAATSDILTATEAIQDTAWTMREKGVPAALCDAIDEQATNIYTACSFQDLTAQRTTKVVDVLRYLENRINTMIDIWGFGKEPDHPGAWEPFIPFDDLDDRMSQSDIDFILVEKPKAAAQQAVTVPAKTVEPEALPPMVETNPIARPRSPKRPRNEMLDEVDQLPEMEKNRLFV